MHESRLVEDLIRESIEVAERNGSGEVIEVIVSIGALSHVTAQSLKSHLDGAADGSALENTTFAVTKSSDTSADDALEIRLVSMTIGAA